MLDVTTSANSTLTNLDAIDGGEGTDVLNIAFTNGTTTLPDGLDVKNVEAISVRSAAGADVDTTGFTGVNTVSIAQATIAKVTAGDATAVNVSGATGAIEVDGGSTNTISASGQNAAVTIGATTVATGAITVAHAKQGTGAIAIDGGTNVNVTASGATTGAVNIGQGVAETDLASGSITIKSTGAAYDAAVAGISLGAITVDGGTTVSITQSAYANTTAAAKDTTTVSLRTQSEVTVNGGDNTTEVTVKQDEAVDAEDGVAAVAGKNEVATVEFAALLSGASVTVGGLTFTASKALTADQVAAAFANLEAGDTQGAAAAGNGIYSGSVTAAFNSAAVVTTGSGSTAKYSVVFTSVAKANATDLAATGVTPVKVDGSAETTAVTGVAGVANGDVTITEKTGVDTIAKVSLDGYGTAAITSDALTTLNLANSNSNVTVTNTKATALDLSLNDVGSTATTLGLGSAYTTLNISTSGDASDVNLTAGGVTALSVSGDKALDLSSSSLGVLKTVTVSGSAGLTLDASGATVTSVNASGTSGDNKMTVDATKATYVGGTGADDVTLSAAAPSKAVSLGAGNDTLRLAAGTTSATAVLSGGVGIDTLVMDAANAVTASAATTFELQIEGFEKLSLGNVTASGTVDLANMDDISYVINGGVAAGQALTLTNMANDGTLEVAAASVASIVTMTDATGTADSLNVLVKAANGIAAGVVDAAGVETIKLVATDSDTGIDGTAIGTHSVTLKDAALKTVNLSGNAGLTLSLDANVVALTLVDGSAMTGVLTASTNGTVAQTIKGGAGADVLTSQGNGDVLIGGAGNDTLILDDVLGTLTTAGSLVTLTGGAGADTFAIGTATANVNSYATITDLTAGDVIQFSTGADNFAASKVSLAATAVFQDFANAAINSTDAGDVSWFQLGGNTYVIENVADGSSFTNGTDIIVQITGTVDLSKASFSSSADTLLIG